MLKKLWSKLENKRYLLIALIIVALFAFFVGWRGFAYFKAYQASQAERNSLIDQQLNFHQNILNDYGLVLRALISENEVVAERIQEEREQRLLSQLETQAANQKIAKLENDLEESKNPNLSEIISGWRPKIAKLRCQWRQGNKILSASGSAVVFSQIGDNLQPAILTSYHILAAAGSLADSCTIQLPDDSKQYSVTEENISRYSKSRDWAIINIPSPSATVYQSAATDLSRCTKEPDVGETIVILGYPSVGSKDDVTATEGIISGKDGYYLITSAKVERGNSGGAAIYAKENCYLGIPSFVNAGDIESLARILKQNIIF
ncbi:MAG: hypothetical protein COU09_00585 [Candidatus Harrisonbacteria bacterium CG10_big_fil_rev_8_21_14_0_10_44_23]|uniref:Serine protease n=1 Tax=Candidatus Harrisonbacteria bacterium CG10_big_fil_rev_8_21_14_0_10_44_23 TaxID=1974585 RepID=A0A2H0UQT1_9BACT|nr:MAG: hypothetical protein COU09_00585 [Candidatus Harrisonbacteria bacterium CG10_big_fil_rev_8_21_14_0_10_44_23]